MDTRAPAWTEPRLFDHGYELVTLTMTVHADGPRGELSCGWLLEETSSGAWVAAEVHTVSTAMGDHSWPIGRLEAALAQLERVLRPF